MNQKPVQNAVHKFKNVFTAEEAVGLLVWAEGQDGWTLGNVAYKDEIDRKERVVELIEVPPVKDFMWVYHKLNDIVAYANQNYQFDLQGFNEYPQVMRYQVGGHFFQHIDIGNDKATYRKVSVTIQLSAAEAYEGGELETFHPNVVASKALGDALVFPSFTPHVVHPVTKGVRYALVAWMAGERAFR